MAGGVPANRIAKWNGSTWSAIGTGCGGTPVLHDQTENNSGQGSSSTDFFGLISNPFLYNEVADDFVVPIGKRWNITQVYVAGSWPINTSSDPVNVIVRFYSHSAQNLPGGQVVCSANVSNPNGASSGNFNLQLGSGCSLPPGTYWLSVQAVGRNDSSGVLRQWLWSDRSQQSNSPSAFLARAGPTQPSCINVWQVKMTSPCVGHSNQPDNIFQLLGTETALPAPTPMPTPEATPFTPQGTNVSTANPAGNGTVTFSEVISGGTTTFTPIAPGSAGLIPQGFNVVGGNTAYEITTTAVVSSPIVVCFTVPTVNDAQAFARIRILHGEDGQMIDRTILAPDTPAPDFAARRVCARVHSLSPFVAVFASAQNFGTISGRVTTPSGQSLRNAVVSIIDGQNNRRVATTSSFGIYTFENAPLTGYVVTVSSKRYRFASRTLNVTGNAVDINFVGLE